MLMRTGILETGQKCNPELNRFVLCSEHIHSGDGSDMNPALPDTSIKLGRYVHKHELFEIFSLANQN